MTHFTKSQLNEIARFMASRSIKDSELPLADAILGSEMVSIVQNGQDKRIPVDVFGRGVTSIALANLQQTLEGEIEDTIEGARHTLQQEFETGIYYSAKRLELDFSERLTTLDADIHHDFDSSLLITARELTSQFEEKIYGAEVDINQHFSSELSMTARALTADFTEYTNDKVNGAMSAFSSDLELTARGLTVDFEEKLRNEADELESNYRSTLSQTARELTAEFVEYTTDKVNDAAAQFSSNLELTARGLETDFSRTLEDTARQVTEQANSYARQTADEIAQGVQKTQTYADGRITELESQLLIQAGLISSKVSESEYNVDKQATFTRFSQVDQTASQIQSTVAAMTEEGGVITNIQSQITQQAGLISQKVSQVDYNEYTGQASIRFSNIEQTVSGIQATVSSISGAGGDIESIQTRLTQAENGIAASATKQELNAVSESVNGVSIDLTGFKSSTQSTLSNYAAQIQSLQNQADNAIETFFNNGAPTLSNYPAEDWDTTEKKDLHLGDLYYDRATGYGYRFSCENDTYSWDLIRDTGVTQALADAANAMGEARSKVTIFTSTPIPPYKLKDLWVKETIDASNNTTYETYYCIVGRAADSTAYNVDADFIPANSTIKKVTNANLKVLSDAIVGNVESFNFDDAGNVTSATASQILQKAGQIRLSVANGAIDTAVAANGKIAAPLLATGINITSGQLELIADKVYVKNNRGRTALSIVTVDEGTAKERQVISADNLQVTGIFSTDAWTTASNGLLTTAQGYATSAETNAKNAAQGYASNAQSLSETYAKNYTDGEINSVKNRLTEWASDGMISPEEKSSLKQTWIEIQAEYEEIDADINLYQLASNAAVRDYISAYNTLAGTSGSTGIIAKYTATTPESITIESDYSAVSNYFTQRKRVISVIAAAAKKYAEDYTDEAQAASETYAKNYADGEVGKVVSRIEDWADDGKVSPEEKSALKQTWIEIQAEYSEISADIARYSLGSDAKATAYVSAYNALAGTGGSTGVIAKYTASEPESITIGSDYSSINAYFAARKEVIPVIANAAKTYAEGYTDDAEARSKTYAKNYSDQEIGKVTTRLTEWASDGYVSPEEKTALKQMWVEIQAEYGEISADISRYGLGQDSNATAYVSAYNTLAGSGSSQGVIAKYTAAEPESIVIGSDYASINAYFIARKNVITAISAKAKQYAETYTDDAEQRSKDYAKNYTDDEVGAVTDRLDEWADDGYVSPEEKSALKQTWVEIQAEYTEISSDIDRYGLAAEPTAVAYVNAYNALGGNNGVIAKYTKATPESIEIENDYGSINAYFVARKAVIPVISNAAKTYAETYARTQATNAKEYITNNVIPGINSAISNLQNNYSGIMDTSDPNSIVSRIQAIEGGGSDVGYLTAAVLNGSTQMIGGLILSSLMQMGYTYTSYTYVGKKIVTPEPDDSYYLVVDSNNVVVESQLADFLVAVGNANDVEEAEDLIEIYSLNSESAILDYLRSFAFTSCLYPEYEEYTFTLEVHRTPNNEYRIMSGINGIVNSSVYGKGIAAWYGGAMLDRYYSENTDANRAAKVVFRMDGSGYLASNHIYWDPEGNSTFEGIVNADGGYIGGWNLSAGSLSTENASILLHSEDGGETEINALVYPHMEDILAVTSWTLGTGKNNYEQTYTFPSTDLYDGLTVQFDSASSSTSLGRSTNLLTLTKPATFRIPNIYFSLRLKLQGQPSDSDLNSNPTQYRYYFPRGSYKFEIVIADSSNREYILYDKSGSWITLADSDCPFRVGGISMLSNRTCSISLPAGTNYKMYPRFRFNFAKNYGQSTDVSSKNLTLTYDFRRASSVTSSNDTKLNRFFGNGLAISYNSDNYIVAMNDSQTGSNVSGGSADYICSRLSVRSKGAPGMNNFTAGLDVFAGDLSFTRNGYTYTLATPGSSTGTRTKSTTFRLSEYTLLNSSSSFNLSSTFYNQYGQIKLDCATTMSLPSSCPPDGKRLRVYALGYSLSVSVPSGANYTVYSNHSGPFVMHISGSTTSLGNGIFDISFMNVTDVGSSSLSCKYCYITRLSQ